MTDIDLIVAFLDPPPNGRAMTAEERGRVEEIADLLRRASGDPSGERTTAEFRADGSLAKVERRLW